jgi:hypothetical protein
MMAQRKDQMRIIRQDAGFSAKLGFGGPVAGQGVDRLFTTAADIGAVAETTTNAEQTGTANAPESDEVKSQVIDTAGLTAHAVAPDKKTRKEEERTSSERLASERRGTAAAAAASTLRGQVVYVSVSLTARQAALAETWAEAARCSVQFLIRHVAQGLREEVFNDWERDGMPEVMEPRGARGKHPTSVTLTLHPQFAAGLSAKHDPLGIMGLARVMGPAFRAKFQIAFDEALAHANIAAVNEGDAK